jgi:hypothetical protein
MDDVGRRGWLFVAMETGSAHRSVPIVESAHKLGIDLYFMALDLPDWFHPLDPHAFGWSKSPT